MCITELSGCLCLQKVLAMYEAVPPDAKPQTGDPQSSCCPKEATVMGKSRNTGVDRVAAGKMKQQHRSRNHDLWATQSRSYLENRW